MLILAGQGNTKRFCSSSSLVCGLLLFLLLGNSNVLCEHQQQLPALIDYNCNELVPMAEQNNFVKDPFKENPIKQMLLSTPAAGESLALWAYLNLND